MFQPLARAIAQLDDPVFLRVALKSVLLSAALFAALVAAVAWWLGLHAGLHGMLAGVLAFLGGTGAVLAGAWLFVPAAIGIATLFTGEVSVAVERRYYPSLPQLLPAPLADQVWDGIALGAQVLLLQLLALLLAIVLPGMGLLLGWAISGWAIGRGLFVAVAMRAMSRTEARRLCARRWAPVVGSGLVLAFGAHVPLLNLLVPVLGTATMVHVLQSAPPHLRGLSRGRGAW